MIFTVQNFILCAGVFFLSACFGSFFKLVVDRYGSSESIVFKSSYCPGCQNRLFWWQNIPLFSYIFLCGKCYFCKSKIDVNCFYSELVAALVSLIFFISLIYSKKSFLQSSPTYLFFMILILLSMFDLKHRIVPHEITYSVILLIAGFNFIFKKDFSTTMLNLGIAFLSMDFLYLFSTIIKRFKLETNFISFPLVIWAIVFLFSQNLYFLILIILLYFISLRYDVPAYLSLISWLLLFVLTLFISYKTVFINFNINQLTLFFCGLGIVYFICEICFYYLRFLFPYLKESNESNSQITIGGADITLFALITTFLGFKISFLALFFASLLVLITRFFVGSKKDYSQYVPFIPYLSFACFIIVIINGF